MGSSADEIDRQIKETRAHIDENLGVLEQRTASNAKRYARIAVVVLAAGAAAGAGWFIYRRLSRPTRRERMQGVLIAALKDLPDTLRDLSDEVATRLKRPLPSIKVVVNGEGEAREPGTLESIARRVAPGVVGTASTALIERFTRPSGSDEDLTSGSSAPVSD